jgi:hypothetical protein
MPLGIGLSVRVSFPVLETFVTFNLTWKSTVVFPSVLFRTCGI